MVHCDVKTKGRCMQNPTGGKGPATSMVFHDIVQPKSMFIRRALRHFGYVGELIVSKYVAELINN